MNYDRSDRVVQTSGSDFVYYRLSTPTLLTRIATEFQPRCNRDGVEMEQIRNRDVTRCDLPLQIAVEGCAHGELDQIYATIRHLEAVEKVKIDLLICCGDFQVLLFRPEPYHTSEPQVAPGRRGLLLEAGHHFL